MIPRYVEQRAIKIANRVKMPYTWETIAHKFMVKLGLWPRSN